MKVFESKVHEFNSKR